MTNIKEGDEIYLVYDHRQNYKLKVKEGERFHTKKGFIDIGGLIGQPYGITVTSSLGASFYVLKPLIRDRVLKTDRRTQVLYPKDISYILFDMDLGSGSKVVEAGTGSGALTMAMANAAIRIMVLRAILPGLLMAWSGWVAVSVMADPQSTG